MTDQNQDTKKRAEIRSGPLFFSAGIVESLMVLFGITCHGNTHRHERCFACYSKDQEALEKKEKVTIANERLKILYDEFEQVSIKYEKQLF